MTISQRGTATKGVHPNGTSVTADKPSGVKNGDVLIAALVSNNQSASAPSGWTKFEDDAVDSFRLQTYYRVAGGFEPDQYTFTVGTDAPLALTVTAWAGVDNNAPIGGAVQSAGGSAAEPYSTPALTSNCTDGRLLYIRAARRTDVSPGTPVAFTAEGVTEVADHGVYSGGSVSYSMAMYVEEQEFSGAGLKPGLATTASYTETHNVVGTYILNKAPYLPHVPVPTGGEILDPRRIEPEEIFTVNETLTFSDDYIEDPYGTGSSDYRHYYRLVMLPTGKGVFQIRTIPPEVPDVTPNSPQYPASVTTIAEALAYDEAHAPQRTFEYNSEGFAIGVYAVVGAQYYDKDGTGPAWHMMDNGGVVAKSYVVGDLPS